MKQKLISLFSTLVIGIGAVMASTTEVDGIWYNFDSSTLTAEVTYQNYSPNPYSYSGIVTIPSSVTYKGVIYDVTSIGGRAFESNAGLTSVIISDGVMSIGPGAFYGCSGLTSVTIPESVGYISNNAFSGCSGLTTVTLNSNTIVSKKFDSTNCLRTIFGSQVSKYIIGNSVTSIGAMAFWNSSNLSSVTIGNNVTSIGGSAFDNCSKLWEVHINDIAAWCAISFSRISSNPLYYAEHLYLNGSEITELTIPHGVTNIGDYAFCNCGSLTSVEIPNSVTSIGEDAFLNCSKLCEVHISDISAWCAISFSGISSNPLYYAHPSFYAHQLYLNDELITNLDIPNSVTSIGNYAFYGCRSLTSVTIPNSVTSIGDRAFNECCCSLTSVLIEAETPPSLGDWAFDGDNSLTSIYVPCGTMEAYISKTGWSNYTSLIKYQPLPYTIITNAQNGSISIESCSDITLTAIPDDGYYFTQWSDGNTDNPRTIVLTQDTTFSAEFSKKQYSINVSCDELCGIINGENGTFDYSSEHTYEAVPNEGYIFQQWSDGNEDNPRTIVLTQDTTITAEFGFFGALLCNVSVQSVDPGMGSASFSDLLETENLNYGQYPTGTNLIAKAQPNQGYKFLHWSDGSTANPYSFILTSDISLTAYFEQSSTSQPENSTFWNMSDDPFNLLGTITSTQTIDGLTIYATSSKNVVIDESNQEIDGLSFTHRLKFGGAGTSDARMLSFEVNGDCNIDIYLKSASGSADRTLNVDKDSFGNTLQQIPAYGSTISKGTVYYIGNTTTIYLYSPSSGVNIYAIRVTYNDDSVTTENTYLVQKERTQKILHNGQLFILRGDKIYTLTGQRK